MVPLSGGPADVPSIDLAWAISRASGRVHLILVYVVQVAQQYPLDAYLPEQVDAGERILRDAEEYARSHGGHQWASVTTALLQARSAAAAIVDEAIERGADAIIVGATNEMRYGELTQGKTVPYILDHAPCDVVVLRVAGEIRTAR
ncbi:MAG: universal stress protein [Sphaerobacter sp.]|nr:universal stress protein [Sphaerobacter sp.]